MFKLIVNSVLVAQSCLPLCEPMDCSPPGSPIHGMLQARILDWVAMPSSRGSSKPQIEPASPALAGRFFTMEPSASPPSNTERGSLYRRLERGCLERASTWQKRVQQTGRQRPPRCAQGSCGCVLCLMDLSHLSTWLNPRCWRQTGNTPPPWQPSECSFLPWKRDLKLEAQGAAASGHHVSGRT